MAGPPKLVLLVICADGGIYNQLQQCWRIWAERNIDYARVFFIRGDKNVLETHLGDDLTIITPDEEGLIPGVLNKTINALDFLIGKYDFEYVIRTNLSSYWKCGLFLQKYCTKLLPTNSCYAGYAGIHQGNLFASGAGIFISPDIAEILVSAQSELDRNLPDDVAIGRLLLGNFAQLIPLQQSRCDITGLNVLPSAQELKRIMAEIFENEMITHARLKNTDRQIDATLYRKMLEHQLAINNLVNP